MKILRLLALMIVLSATPVWAQQQARQQMELTAAVIKEQNVSFAVVIVRAETFNDKTVADGIVKQLEPVFGNVPVVLMAQDAKGTPTFYGRPDIAKFLSQVSVDRMPWKKYTLSY
jgi:hypothetical protein